MSVVGFVEGSDVGEREGSIDEGSVGDVVEGANEGKFEALNVGFTVGRNVGSNVGDVVGMLVGRFANIIPAFHDKSVFCDVNIMSPVRPVLGSTALSKPLPNTESLPAFCTVKLYWSLFKNCR